MSSIVNKIANALTPADKKTNSPTNTSLAHPNKTVDPVQGFPVGKSAADLVKDAEYRRQSNGNNGQQSLLGNNTSGIQIMQGRGTVQQLQQQPQQLQQKQDMPLNSLGSSQPVHTTSSGTLSDVASTKATQLLARHKQDTGAPLVDRSTKPSNLSSSDVGTVKSVEAQPLEHTLKQNVLVSATSVPEVHVKPIHMPDVHLKPIDTQLPVQQEQTTQLPKLQAIKVNSTFASNSPSRSLESPSTGKISELLAKLNNTATEVDNMAKEKHDQISREAAEAIAKVLAQTEANQKALVEDCNKRTDDIDNTYKEQLRLYVTGLDKIRANSLAQLEKEFETRQSELLLQAKRNIDSINADANKQKLQVLTEAQKQSMNRINSITESVAALALQDATKRLNSTITTTITTNTKGIVQEALEAAGGLAQKEDNIQNNNNSGSDFNKHGNLSNESLDKSVAQHGTEPRTQLNRPVV